MRDTNLVNALREHAEWAEGNQWETPITQHNYPETVQLGDAFQVRDEEWSL